MNKLIITLMCITIVCLFLFIGVTGADSIFSHTESKETAQNLIILHTNDVHGYLGENIGYDGLSAYVKDCRAEGADVLLLDAGDAFRGLPYVNYFNGSSAAELMSRLGYAAMTVGNHEFGLDEDQLMNYTKTLPFPLLGANVLNRSTGKPLFADSVIINISNKKIGVFGLVTPEAKAYCHYNASRQPIFVGGEELYRIAQDEVNKLKGEGCDLIICLAHLGLNAAAAQNRSSDVAAHVLGIDIIIDGHSHTELPEGMYVNTTLIVNTGENFKNIGVIRFSNDGKPSASLVSAKNYSKKDAEITQIISNDTDVVDAILGDILIGNTTVHLVGERAESRTHETNLGDLLADAFLWYAKKSGVDADFALINGGRISIPPGNITELTILNLLPYEYQVVVTNLSGALLQEIIEANTATTPEQEGGFPHVSGVTYSINISKPYVPGKINRVHISTVNGKAFDPETEYTMVTSEFLAGGGYKYTPLIGKPITRLEVSDSDALTTYITEELNGSVDSRYEKPLGRITILKATDTSVSRETSPTATPVTSPVPICGLLVALATVALFSFRTRK